MLNYCLGKLIWVLKHVTNGKWSDGRSLSTIPKRLILPTPITLSLYSIPTLALYSKCLPSPMTKLLATKWGVKFVSGESCGIPSDMIKATGVSVSYIVLLGFRPCPLPSVGSLTASKLGLEIISLANLILSLWL